MRSTFWTHEFERLRLSPYGTEDRANRRLGNDRYGKFEARLSWAYAGNLLRQGRETVDRLEALNPYNRKVIPGSILNIVQELNFDSEGRQQQLYGYGISAKRHALYIQGKSGIHLIKISEHGLGLYYRPKKGHDADCEVPAWIKEGWQWMLNRALGFRCHKPQWFRLPVMRRIAMTTPNVMAALRRLRRPLKPSQQL